MPTEAKARIIEETAALLDQAQGAVLADYQGLTVQQLTELRQKLGQQGVRLKVVKNTLLRQAAASRGIHGLDPYLQGPTILATAVDAAVGARALTQAVREYPRRLEIKAGILGQRVLDAQAVRTLAELPSREQLLAKLLGTLLAPIQQTVWVLNAPLAQLARALDQIREKQQAAQSA